MKVIELRPDSKLLKSNFDGYKLSLEPIPILRLENIPTPDRVHPSGNEYSFLHSSLYQLHNGLVTDPWLHSTAYYLDSSHCIQKLQYDVNTGKLRPLLSVFRCSIKRQAGADGIYNCDFKFISEKFAVLSDGIGGLRIIETGDRLKSDEWKSLQTLQPLNGAGFIIQDAKFTIENGEKSIHALLLHIEQLDGKFQNIVDWITWKQSEGAKSWEETARRTLQGRGSLHYLSLDPKCKAIVYSSNYKLKYVFDSVNEIICEGPPAGLVEGQQDEAVDTFKWTQEGEDITVNFNRIPDSTKEQYQIKCDRNRIEIICDTTSLLSSDLFSEIDTDLTTWSLESDFLQLNLVKKNSALVWPYLVPGGPPQESGGEKQPELLGAPVADLNSQMEECDYGDEGYQGEEFFIGKFSFLLIDLFHSKKI